MRPSRLSQGLAPQPPSPLPRLCSSPRWHWHPMREKARGEWGEGGSCPQLCSITQTDAGFTHNSRSAFLSVTPPFPPTASQFFWRPLFSLPLSTPATPLPPLFGFVWATKARISNIMCLHYTKSILKLVRFIVASPRPPPSPLPMHTHTHSHMCGQALCLNSVT